jgi:1-phosphofructokinase family hexose kinase
MKREPSIITVGLSPAWDITCRVKNPDWGEHINIDDQTIVPAGKALNVSRALAWMGQKNISAGLWGADDYKQMQTAVQSSWPLIKIKMTPVEGNTRKNITIVDTTKHREMHLRNKSELANMNALRKIRKDLQVVVKKNSICVFSGAMPEGRLLEEAVKTIKSCRDLGAKIVLDTSGPALRKIVKTGLVWLLKPNIAELNELTGQDLENNSASLIQAGGKLLGKVEIVLISRGEKGAVVVTKDTAWEGKCISRKKALSTVGCGDYLLAGFLKGLENTSKADEALTMAIKTATLRAWGITKQKSWPQIAKKVQIRLRRLK